MLMTWRQDVDARLDGMGGALLRCADPGVQDFQSGAAYAEQTIRDGIGWAGVHVPLHLARGKILFLSLPGEEANGIVQHLKTDLGGNGDFEVDVGAAEVRRIMLEAGPEMNGKSVNIHVPGWENAMGKYDGAEIPW